MSDEALWFVASGGLLILMAAFQASHSEETVGSLEDVISSRDQARLEKVLTSAQPYSTLREAYYVAKGAGANKNV